MKIEFQYFEGCPTSIELLKNLKIVLSQFDGEMDYNEILVETSEKAAEVDFRGSPTLLINGEDFDGMPVPQTPRLACRVYRQLPTAEVILQRLKSLV